MESYKLVLPEHLNHWGYLFGGNMLKWVDEAGWIAATREHPGCRLVTFAMDRVEFRKPVKQGAIVRLVAERVKRGTTSVTYTVEAFADNLDGAGESSGFKTHITLVNVDADGRKTPLPSR